MDESAATLGLGPVSQAAASAYERHGAELTVHVNRAIEQHPALWKLTGQNARETMRSGHENHLRLWTAAFRAGKCELLELALPWIYDTYRARGFDYAYFPTVFECWIAALDAIVEQPAAGELIDVYRQLLSAHDRFVEGAEARAEARGQRLAAEPGAARRQDFLSLLLLGDTQATLRFCNDLVLEAEDLGDFYDGIVQPCMAEIEHLWASGEISIAHEHLAWAIVGRVCAQMFERFPPPPPKRGKALVTAAAAAAQFETTARMKADLLELDGWDVTFMPASAEMEEVLATAIEKQPTFLSISVAIPFKLGALEQLVRKLKEIPALAEMKLMIGAEALDDAPDLGTIVGAHGWAPDAKSAVTIARGW